MITFLSSFMPLWLIYLIFACLFTSAINPFMYFIRYVWFERGEYIKKHNTRPTIKDYWDTMMDTWSHAWWIPVSDIICFIYIVLYLIFKPFNSLWNKFINKIKDIRI